MTEFDDMPDLKLSMFAIAALFRIHFICYLPKGRLKTVRLVLAKFLLKSNALSLSDDIAMQAHTLVWFRRNLRIRDNAALSAAVKRGLPAAGVWVAQGSSEISNPRQDWFHYQAAAALHGSLAASGVALYAVNRVEELPALATRLNVQTVIADEAYTSPEIGQDNRIWRILDEQGVAFERVNDRTVFAKADIMGSHGAPYTDFPHYKEAWLALFRQRFGGRDAGGGHTEIFQTASVEMPSFPAWNGQQDMVSAQRGGEDEADKQWRQFEENIGFYPIMKDFPARKGTSRLSAYLSAGCISPRVLATEAAGQGADAWLDNLIRRDFYQQLAYHRARIEPESAAESAPFSDDLTECWRQGKTGFPLIDAAMRSLKSRGWLHPALRSLTAEFLCGVLHQPSEYGIAWFAAQQTDFDPALNEGNWQTAARNARRHSIDIIQTARRLDPAGTFVRRHIPELAHLPVNLVHTPWLASSEIDAHGYPLPVVAP